MGCRDGACTLKQPLELSLISLSLVRFDGRGLAQSLPSTWTVRGGCRSIALSSAVRLRTLSSRKPVLPAGRSKPSCVD